MFDLEDRNKGCERTLEELERVPREGDGLVTASRVLGMVSAEARAHAAKCAGCREAVEQLAETRNLLGPLSEAQAEPGPWFVTGVMAAIEAQEREEEREGVWANVRRLAPRLVAFCTLLLVLGGTWAIQVKKTENAERKNASHEESLFEPTGAMPLNDDVLINLGGGEVRR